VSSGPNASSGGPSPEEPIRQAARRRDAATYLMAIPQHPALGCATRSAPLLTNGPGLALDTGKKCGVAFALQPHPDKRTKNDLDAHWQLEHSCRSARHAATLTQH